MEKTNTFYVVIDLGGTHLRLAARVSLDQAADWQTEQFTLTHNFTDDFEHLVTLIKQQTSGRQITAIGFALPGFLNDEQTKLIRAHNLPEWVNQPITENLTKQFNCPVYLENDAVASALGEVYYGGQKGQDFLLTIWGTGVGGALMAQGAALQVEKTDYHKYLAAIEDRCGGKAIHIRFGKPAGELSDDEWEQVINEFLASIKQVGLILGVSKIICGGGIAIKQKDRLQVLAARIFDHKITFQVSTLGIAESFGLYGAAALIRHRSPVK